MPDRKFRLHGSALAVVVMVSAACLFAGVKGKAAIPKAPKKKSKSAPATKSKSTAHGAANSKKTTHASPAYKKSSVRSTKSRRRLPHTSRGRLALLHLDPQRVEEIQQALIKEGSLSGEPTGTWDNSTKVAMKQYQAENGFAATGLPDAKSLMKLGLGPHPLPYDVQLATAPDTQTKIDSLEHPKN